MINPIAHLAERVSTDPSFLAYHLTQYARKKGWSQDELAHHLGLPLDRLASLGLCRTPRHNTDLLKIAEHVEVNPFVLREVAG